MSSTSSAPHGRSEGGEQAAEHDRGAAPKHRNATASSVRRVRVTGSTRGVYHLPGADFAPGDFEDPAEFNPAEELAAENEEYEALGLLPRVGETDAEALSRRQRREDEDEDFQPRRSRDLAPAALCPPRRVGPLKPAPQRRGSSAEAYAAYCEYFGDRDDGETDPHSLSRVDDDEPAKRIGGRTRAQLRELRQQTRAFLRSPASLEIAVRRAGADRALTLEQMRAAFSGKSGRPTAVQRETRAAVRAALVSMYEDDHSHAGMAELLGCPVDALRRLMG